MPSFTPVVQLTSSRGADLPRNCLRPLANLPYDDVETTLGAGEDGRSRAVG